MPARKASPIELSAEHERELTALVRAHSTPQKLAERARIILLAAKGLGVEETASELGIWRKTASTWRRRWRDADATAGVAVRLSDAPRSGAPATFTPEVICKIVALSCENPETLDVPISHWSQSELARQAVRRGIVEPRLRFPTRCSDCGKRKFGRTQPDQALRRSARPSRSSARRARHALRKKRLRVAPRGCALPLTAAPTGAL